MKELLKCKSVITATVMTFVGAFGLMNTLLVENSIDSKKVSGAKVIAEDDLKEQLSQIELESKVVSLAMIEK